MKWTLTIVQVLNVAKERASMVFLVIRATAMALATMGLSVRMTLTNATQHLVITMQRAPTMVEGTHANAMWVTLGRTVRTILMTVL